MSKHHHHGAGGKRRREADADGGDGGGDVVTPTPPAHGGNAKAAALGRHHDKHQRPAHKPHKKPRVDGNTSTPTEQQTAEKKKKKKKHRHPKKKPGAGAAALAPPPPKPGSVASLITGSNWAQLRAKLSAEGAEGGGGKKRHNHHANRRPTLNELAAGQQQQQQEAAAADDDANGGKRKKKNKPELRPITALTPASLPGPILTGGSVAMAAAAALKTTTTTTATTVAAAAAATTTTTTTTTTTAPLTQVLAIDCEMVGVGPEGKRSALARVCLVNDQGHVVLDTFVSPKERVTDYRTWVSGVRAEDLRDAPPLEEVQRRVAALVAGRVLVGHSLSGDLKALLLSHPRKLVRDTARYPPLMRRAFKAPEGVAASVAADIARGKRRPKALRVLAAQELGLDIQSGEHTPVDDARAALYLYLHHAREWERAIRRGDVSKLPVGVQGGAAGVAAAVAAARQARAMKQKKKMDKGGGGGGGGGARSNTLDVRELARQDPFADL
jgi:RNA exonuclease 4